MNKEKLMNEMIKCLDQHEKEYNEDIISNYIDNWYNSKGKLINILRKHPNWNEDAMAILFDYDYEREVDDNIYSTTLNQLMEIWVNSFKGKTIKLKLRYDVPTVCLSDVLVSILGQDVFIEDFSYNYDFITILNGEKIFIPVYATELCGDHKKISVLFDNNSPAVTEKMKNAFDSVGIKCAINQKTSRVINKVFKELGIDTHENYNSLFAKLADSMNPLKITRHTLLSVHPCDYLHMSYGDNWNSCHNLDNGEYMAGTLSYMLDETSMILYTVSNSYDGNEFWAEKRINRQVFCYDNNVLLQSRLYPDYSDIKNNDNFRAIVQQIFAVCLEKDNLWKLDRIVDEYLSTHHGSKHYRDYDYQHFNPTISLLKDEEHGGIKIGASAACLMCGEGVEECDTLYCCDHMSKYCEHCGDYSHGREMHEINDYWYCENCCFYCEHCEEWCTGDSYSVETKRYSTLTVCEYCIRSDDYHRCYECGSYIYYEDAIFVTDTEQYICDDCRDRYYFVCEDCGETFSSSDFLNDGLCPECTPVLELETV